MRSELLGGARLQRIPLSRCVQLEEHDHQSNGCANLLDDPVEILYVKAHQCLANGVAPKTK